MSDLNLYSGLIDSFSVRGESPPLTLRVPGAPAMKSRKAGRQ